MSDENGTLSVGERISRLEARVVAMESKVVGLIVSVAVLGVIVGAVKVVELVLG